MSDHESLRAGWPRVDRPDDSLIVFHVGRCTKSQHSLMSLLSNAVGRDAFLRGCPLCGRCDPGRNPVGLKRELDRLGLLRSDSRSAETPTRTGDFPPSGERREPW